MNAAYANSGAISPTAQEGGILINIPATNDLIEQRILQQLKARKRPEGLAYTASLLIRQLVYQIRQNVRTIQKAYKPNEARKEIRQYMVQLKQGSAFVLNTNNKWICSWSKFTSTKTSYNRIQKLMELGFITTKEQGKSWNVLKQKWVNSRKKNFQLHLSKDWIAVFKYLLRTDQSAVGKKKRSSQTVKKQTLKINDLDKNKGKIVYQSHLDLNGTEKEDNNSLQTVENTFGKPKKNDDSPGANNLRSEIDERLGICGAEFQENSGEKKKSGGQNQSTAPNKRREVPPGSELAVLISQLEGHPKKEALTEMLTSAWRKGGQTALLTTWAIVEQKVKEYKPEVIENERPYRLLEDAFLNSYGERDNTKPVDEKESNLQKLSSAFEPMSESEKRAYHQKVLEKQPRDVLPKSDELAAYSTILWNQFCDLAYTNRYLDRGVHQEAKQWIYLFIEREFSRFKMERQQSLELLAYLKTTKPKKYALAVKKLPSPLSQATGLISRATQIACSVANQRGYALYHPTGKDKKGRSYLDIDNVEWGFAKAIEWARKEEERKRVTVDQSNQLWGWQQARIKADQLALKVMKTYREKSFTQTALELKNSYQTLCRLLDKVDLGDEAKQKIKTDFRASLRFTKQLIE